MAQGKSDPPYVPFDHWPSSLPSHNIWQPGATVTLSPFARVREPGEIGQTAKSATRALDIVELLAREGRPLRAIEIAAALELSPSSAHQLLKTMADSAWLLFDPFTKRYHGSPRAARLGGLWFDQAAIARIAGTVHDALGLRLVICAAQGASIQIVDMFDPPAIGRRRAGPGRDTLGVRVPIFGTTTGAAWLSAQSDPTVLATARLCRRELGPLADDPDRILDLVRRVREQGHAFGGISADGAIRAVSIPLPPNRDGIVLVASITAAAEVMEERQAEIAGVLREAIHRELGAG